MKEETKRKCLGKTKSGEPCQAYALEGSDWCAQHQPKKENRGRRSKMALIQPIPTPPLPTVEFAHPSKLLCGVPAANYPAFMGKKCDTPMRVDSIKENGRVKYWKCPKCGNTSKTIGEPARHSA